MPTSCLEDPKNNKSNKMELNIQISFFQKFLLVKVAEKVVVVRR